MAAFRLFLIALTLAVFLIFGVPLQSLVRRFAPGATRLLPVLFCRALLFLLRIDTERCGADASDRPLLLVSNHVSWIDVLVFGAIMPFCFLAKSDVASWPILSAFVDIQGTVFVDRRRKRSIPGANRQLAARMIEGRSVLLFPEGTTSDAPAPSRFLSSHFAAARDLLRLDPATPSVAVQPVAIAYSSPAAAWIGDDDLFSHLWRTLKNPPLQCRVSFGASLSYTRSSDRKRIARATRSAVVSLLRSPATAPAGCRERLGDGIGGPAAKIL